MHALRQVSQSVACLTVMEPCFPACSAEGHSSTVNFCVTGTMPAGALLGGVCRTATWLAYAKIKLGAVVSLGLSLFLCIGISLIWPAKQKFR